MKIKLFLLVGVLLLSGCATCASSKYTTNIFKNFEVEKNGLVVQFGPITDREQSIWYLNLPPAKYDLLPIFISIVNKGSSIKKIDVDDTYLMDNLKQVKYESLAIEKVVKTLQVSGWVPSVLFGMTGSIIAGSTEKNKDDALYRKAFKPRILNPGGSGEGVFFFKVPKGDVLNNEFVLYLIVEDLNNNTTEELQTIFTTR